MQISKAQKEKAYRDRSRHRAKTFVAKYLAMFGHCANCGENRPIVLDFDHDDPATKTRSISGMMRQRCGIATIKQEIRKCTVRCANCHRVRTHKQSGGKYKS